MEFPLERILSTLMAGAITAGSLLMSLFVLFGLSPVRIRSRFRGVLYRLTTSITRQDPTEDAPGNANSPPKTRGVHSADDDKEDNELSKWFVGPERVNDFETLCFEN